MANASDHAQSNEAVAHAERAYSTAQSSYNQASFNMGSDINNSHDAAALQQAASYRAQAYADKRSAQIQADSLTADNQARTHQQVNTLAQAEQASATNAHYTDHSWRTLTPTSTYSEPQTTVSFRGISQRPGAVTSFPTAKTPATVSILSGNKTASTDSINVSVSTLSPSTQINTTFNGVTASTTAGELAKINPDTQIAVPHTPALIVSQHQGSDHSNSNTCSQNGTGRGGDNAHSHAFGGHGYGHDNSRSEGFGGHSHLH